MKMRDRRPEPMRVQKYVSRSGVASRRQAEALMREGRILVNGVPVTAMGSVMIPGVDTVTLDGTVVRPAARRWVVLHKPTGVLCTRADPHGGETIYDGLPDWAASLRYVGRLDRETSGVLLMTNDGDLGAALAHPSSRVEREYVARVAGQVTARALRSLRRGVELEDGFVRPRLVRKVRVGEEDWGLRLIIMEGRKREVRRLRASGRGVGAHAFRSLSARQAGARRLEARTLPGTGGGTRPGEAAQSWTIAETHRRAPWVT